MSKFQKKRETGSVWKTGIEMESNSMESLRKKWNRVKNTSKKKGNLSERKELEMKIKLKLTKWKEWKKERRRKKIKKRNNEVIIVRMH